MQILEIREEGQRLRAEHDKLLSRLLQSVRPGDVIDLPDSAHHPRRRVTVADPFLDQFGGIVPVVLHQPVQRFRLDIETIEETLCPSSPDPSAQAQGEP